MNVNAWKPAVPVFRTPPEPSSWTLLVNGLDGIGTGRGASKESHVIGLKVTIAVRMVHTDSSEAGSPNSPVPGSAETNEPGRKSPLWMPYVLRGESPLGLSGLRVQLPFKNRKTPA